MRGRVVPWVLVGLALFGLVLLSGGPGDDGPPLDPDNTGELGTRGLVLLLEEFDAEVDVTSVPRDHDVALLLADRLDEIDRERLNEWVQAGGTLVVTDPGSPLGAQPAVGDFFGGLVDASIGADQCDVDAFAGLDRVDPSGGIPLAVFPGDQSCFGDGVEAFVVVSDRRQGTVVSIGGAGAFTNGTLGSEDNAALAVTVLAPEPGTRIAFLEPPEPGTGDKSLSDLVAPGIKLALVQLAIAFVVYALWRTIRLGRPVAEPQPIEIDSSEFVSAVGNLLAERRDPQLSAQTIAAASTRSFAAALGLGPATDAAIVATAVADRTGRDVHDVEGLLRAAPVSSDDDLVALTLALDRLEQELLHGEPTPS
ncbi:MAG TPA: DUF4350 domain-containing protein [Acidimicrobiales bacterium]|nr:DUF4350 domain-containing protein [Acidimicrobiales bacterium]